MTFLLFVAFCQRSCVCLTAATVFPFDYQDFKKQILCFREKENTSQVLTPRFFTDLMTSSNLHDVLPPPFHRITPSLMPPSDDEVSEIFYI